MAGLHLMAGFDVARTRLAFQSGHGAAWPSGAATDPGSSGGSGGSGGSGSGSSGSGRGSGSCRPVRCATCAWGVALSLGPTLNAPARAAGLRAA